MKKQKVKILVEKGNPDHGPIGFQINVNGMEISHETPVFLNFDKEKFICNAVVTKEKNFVYAEMRIEEKYLSLFPAVGIRSEKIGQGLRYIDKCKLDCIGLCNKENVDNSIKSILEQIQGAK